MKLILGNDDVKLLVCNIKDLDPSGYTLSDSIEFSITREEDTYYLFNKEYNLLSEGNNLIEAISDMRYELMDLYDDLNDHTDDQLSSEMLCMKKSLNKIMEKK